jgi:ABC-type transport system involved in cytochrome bd biosynthesis fused ATPase/permease subunit
MTIQRVTLEVLFRVRWLPVIVVLLCLAAIIWTLLAPQAWTSALVLVGAAVPLAILGKDAA